MLAPRSATSYATEHQRRAVLRQMGVALEPTPLLTDRAAYISYLERQLETTVAACMQLHSLEARVAQLSTACARQEERTVAMARLMKCQQGMFEEHEALYLRANEALELRVRTLEQALGRSVTPAVVSAAAPFSSAAVPPVSAADAAIAARFRAWEAEQQAAAAALEERLAARLAGAGAAAERAAEAAAERAVGRRAASAAASSEPLPPLASGSDGVGAAAATLRELRTQAALAAAAVPPAPAAAAARNAPLAAAVPGWERPAAADVAMLHREGLVHAAQRAAAPPEAASLADAARDAEARRRRLAAMFAELAPGAETPLPRSY